MKTLLLILITVFLFSTEFTLWGKTKEYDIVIYGGTSSGIAAAIQASRMNKSVVLIEPSRRIGGLTTGGLGQTDIGNKQAIGGISREFYENISSYYSKASSWNWQAKADYKDGGQTQTHEGEEAMWTFEPSAALKVFKEMLDVENVDLVYEARLDRKSGVVRQGLSISEIRMENGDGYRGRMFIDASYEGDLLAAAGISYVVGRESNRMYGETLNGVQANYYHPTLSNTVSRNGANHNFKPRVDPYIVQGDPSSGLLPFITADGKPGLQGIGDKGVQAYCFRMTLTDHPANRIPFAKPENYKELNYELLFRNYEAGENRLPWINSDMPNRKTDTNNKHGFSTDFIGQNYSYPEGSYEEREAIVEAHREYQQGLMWTLANHPRIPQEIREEFSRWGTCKDEYERSDGWQQQLYVREARRMASDYMMRQQHCEGLELALDSVGLAAYGMDSHMVQRYVDANGYVQNEGNVQAHVIGPYPISYRSIVPKKSECDNLLAPVCLSATHIAFGSIRMEPVFMVLGQSAATAASLAIDDGVPLREIHYRKLKAQLLEDRQVLKGAEQAVESLLTPSYSIKGYLVDDSDARREGDWVADPLLEGVHQGFRHEWGRGNGVSKATFEAVLPYSGEYEVQISYIAEANRASNVPLSIEHDEGVSTLEVDQRDAPDIDGLFKSVGRYHFGKSGSVSVNNLNTDGYVVIDAVRWLLKNADDPRERWAEDIERWKAEDARKGGLEDGILFMGSSSILMWDYVTNFPEYDTRGRGFGGSKIWELPALYEEILEPHTPEHIVIYTSENDLSVGRSVEEILEDWHALYGRIRRDLPNAQLYFISVKRSPRREYMEQKIVDFNRVLKAEIESTDYVTYIDGDSPLIASDGSPDPSLFRDGLHLNETGYKIWSKLLKEAIQANER